MTTLSIDSSLLGLKDQLSAELDIARELRPVLLLKQQSLVGNHLSALQPLCEHELRLAAAFAIAEGRRLATLLQLADDFGLPNENFTLSLLSRRLQGYPLLLEIEQLAAELAGEIAELQLINDDNRHLTQNLLDYAGLVIRLAARQSGEACYTRNGEFDPVPAARALLDDRV